MPKVAISGYLLLALVMGAAGACRSSLDSFTCSSDRDCQLDGVNGFCEAEMLCSFADTGCLSGRRFGKLAGETSNECVTEAAVDAAPVEDPAADADLPRPDATNIPPADAMPEADATATCTVHMNATTCEAAACPGMIDENCCVYQTTSTALDCNDVCNAVGKNCEGAFTGINECSPGDPKPCGQNSTGNMCYCL